VALDIHSPVGHLVPDPCIHQVDQVGATDHLSLASHMDQEVHQAHPGHQREVPMDLDLSTALLRVAPGAHHKDQDLVPDLPLDQNQEDLLQDRWHLADVKLTIFLLIV